jgi:hypothetical protein
MIPLYTKEEFEHAKSRKKLPLKCHNCEKTFYKSKNLIMLDLSHNRSKDRKHSGFCSQKCAHDFLYTPTIVKCKQCGKEFKKMPNQIKKYPNHFCCQSCSAIYNNSHKTKGTRVSKLEKWLQSVLSKTYPNLEIHFNRKDAINGELDIYVPALKVAFELNGIFHYEPIYGIDKLSSIQTNDNRKMQACLENGIELCVIDSSSLSYFKEKNAIKYFDIIKNIIDLKLKSEANKKD